MDQIQNLADLISNLKIIELIELSKKLELMWGVSSINQVLKISDNLPSKEIKIKKSKFNVSLIKTGLNKVSIIKEIRSLINLGLKDTKEFVENPPKIIKSEILKEEAESIKLKLESLGAIIEIN